MPDHDTDQPQQQQQQSQPTPHRYTVEQWDGNQWVRVPDTTFPTRTTADTWLRYQTNLRAPRVVELQD